MNDNTQAEAYRRMYHRLFHAATAAQSDMIKASIAFQQINLRLQKAQMECEDLLLRMTDDEEQGYGQDEESPMQL